MIGGGFQKSACFSIGCISTIEEQLAQDGREFFKGLIGFRGEGGLDLPAGLHDLSISGDDGRGKGVV